MLFFVKLNPDLRFVLPIQFGNDGTFEVIECVVVSANPIFIKSQHRNSACLLACADFANDNGLFAIMKLLRVTCFFVLFPKLRLRFSYNLALEELVDFFRLIHDHSVWLEDCSLWSPCFVRFAVRTGYLIVFLTGHRCFRELY